MKSALAISSLFGLAVSQSTTVMSAITVPFIGYDAKTMAASVVEVREQVTTLQLGCLEDDGCGLFPNQTLIYGPSTYNMNMADGSTDFTATVDCVFASSSAVCQETAGGSEANFPGTSTATYNGTQIESKIVMMTAGLEKLPTPTAASTSASGPQFTGPVSTGAAAANSVMMGSGAITVAGLIMGWLL